MSPFDLALGLLQNVVAGVLSIVFIGLIRASFWKRNREIPGWFQGILFSGAAFVGMLFPVIYSPGVFRDFRNSLVALASFYGGIRSGLVAAGIAGAFRFYLGGGGTFGGIMGLFSSAVLGALFGESAALKNQKITSWRLPLLGGSLFFITFLWSWTLPREQVWTAVQTFFLPELIAYPIVTSLFGYLYQMETDRQSSTKHFRAVFNESSFGILMVDAAVFRIIDVNPALSEMLGYRRSELLTLTLADIVEQTHLPEIRRTIEERQIGRDYKAERQFFKKSGELVWMTVALTEVREQAGEAAYIAVLEDITQRKQAEESLQRYLQRLEILHKTDRAILKAQSTEMTIQESLRFVKEMIPCRQASVTLFDLNPIQARVVTTEITAEGPATAWSIVSFDQLPQIEKLENGEALSFPDLTAVCSSDERFQSLLATGIHAFAMIPLNIHEQLIGSLNLGATIPYSFDKGKIEIAYEVANSLAVAIQNTRLMEEIMRHQRELKRLSALIIEAQEAERKRISVELHDEMGQALTGISIQLGVIEKMIRGKTDPAIRDRLKEAKLLANQASDQIRNLAFRLRPSILDDLGLEPALRWYVGRYIRRTNIQVNLDLTICESDIETDIKTHLYRVAQETLNNIAKHADAGNVEIRLSCDRGWAVLVIEDDGRGFEIDQNCADNASGRGLGLLGMRERIAFINGIFQIQSLPGQGTRITAKVPTSSKESFS